MLKKTNFLFILLIITVGSELVLLNQNFSLKKAIRENKHYKEKLLQLQSQQEHVTSEGLLEGKELPIIVDYSLVQQFQKVDLMKTKFVVIFYFTRYDCSSCLHKEIPTWNEFTALNKNMCQVIGVVDSPALVNPRELAEHLNISFPLYGVSDLKTQLHKYNIHNTPVVLFGETSSKRILYAHFPTPARCSKESFIPKLQIILDSTKT